VDTLGLRHLESALQIVGYDVLVVPDNSDAAIRRGLPPFFPPPYAGGLGEDGVAAIAAFVREGGTLVALNEASEFAIRTFGLPVRNAVGGLKQQQFYAPGSIFRLVLDTAHALARGMPREANAWYEDGPVFEAPPSSAIRVVGRYPADSSRVLLSGWVVHPERAAGRGALVEARVGRGRVILFGFRPQYRGQSLATFPLLFNALMARSGSTMVP
jgi:hypothetical protein